MLGAWAPPRADRALTRPYSPSGGPGSVLGTRKLLGFLKFLGFSITRILLGITKDSHLYAFALIYVEFASILDLDLIWIWMLVGFGLILVWILVPHGVHS